MNYFSDYQFRFHIAKGHLAICWPYANLCSVSILLALALQPKGTAQYLDRQVNSRLHTYSVEKKMILEIPVCIVWYGLA